MSGHQGEPLTPELLASLQRVSTGTACGQLIKFGISRTYLKGISPIVPVGPNKRVVGRAVTARFLPLREDVPQAWRSHQSFREALDTLQPHDVLVVDAMGCHGGAIVGDILCTRIKHRGGAAVVVDGPVRDATGMREVALPVFARCLHAAPAPPYLINTDVNLPIQCGGTLVLPGDVILADDDGAVVIPRALAPKVAEAGGQNEEMEAFIRSKVERGTAISDIYPPTPTLLQEFEEYRASTHRT